ncbi:MAG: tetratricopeptide repeat protein [Desulfobacterales bacterium]
MSRQKKQSTDVVKRQTLVTSVVIALMVGFFLGVVFGVYQSSSPLPSQAQSGSPSSADRNQMLEGLMERVKGNPDDTAAWIQLGNLHFDASRFNEAIEAYEKSLELEPGNAMVLTDLGIMYRRIGKPREAVERFDRAIAADPKLENPRYNKGVVLLHDLKDREGAVQAWEGLLEVNPLAMAPNGQSVDELVTQYRQSSGN